MRIVRNVPDCHKTLKNISWHDLFYFYFGLNVTWTCSHENSGKHVHAHVIWKQTLTYWRVCEDLIPPVDENPHQHQQTQDSERGNHSQRNNRPLLLLCASHHPDTRLRTAVTRLWSEKQEQNCPWPIHWSMISSIHSARHIQGATKTQPNNQTASCSRVVKAFNVLHLNKNHTAIFSNLK